MGQYPLKTAQIRLKSVPTGARTGDIVIDVTERRRTTVERRLHQWQRWRSQLAGPRESV
jgi:hypothetical protein